MNMTANLDEAPKATIARRASDALEGVARIRAAKRKRPPYGETLAARSDKALALLEKCVDEVIAPPRELLDLIAALLVDPSRSRVGKTWEEEFTTRVARTMHGQTPVNWRENRAGEAFNDEPSAFKAQESSKAKGSPVKKPLNRRSLGRSRKKVASLVTARTQ